MPPVGSRRACDRCHSLKERCHWRQDQGSCARCHRLGFECLVDRPARKPGRPRRYATSLTRAPLPGDSSPNQAKCLGSVYSTLGPMIPRCLPLLNDLTYSDQRLLQDILFGDAALNVFLIGPTFKERHRGLLISHFVVSRHTLEDAFLALALAFSHDAALAQRNTEVQYKHASSAIRHLREYKVRNSHGVSECLALGALIISFTHYRSSSPDSSPICRQTLSLIKDMYESDEDLEPDDLVFVPCLILPEIIDCMMQGSVPTLRFRCRPGAEDYVDRYTGLFCPMLPSLYDIYHQDLHDILEAIDRIELTVTAWQPHIPEGFATRFTTNEVSHMLCQAQVVRLGALLLLHRLRYPFGTNNGPALALATAILTQLDLTRAATNHSILSIALPLLAACFEIKEETDRNMWLSKIPGLVGYSLDFSQYLQARVSKFWELVDDVQVVSWYNIRDMLQLYN
ncbi:uncharacterized protein NECHADRAFT_82975 [Fusarium vanettenii 77-13-4]|uniref:Zn(2)-C6 fungal-type domain-containing protein n=1 Tax=Fusarium vanettenii (strain ATCC MYA-4622 / CBS 123669 / FGSC 9596 / NRRL 45880 / 77-13-4) TaxID=660122 RepID=C7ZAT5_FUSV7|nr:uncharacterized protein NECHADRAFT_82975 [Fusarium vanettenii 77-13-4]EEU38763.1 hypothetical protein NECHADRAFT_82975 [Fusarium vanettenii 77-13-4]